MGFEFRKKPARKKASEPLTDHQREYREREKREEERFKMAVDTRYWCCFCFHDEDEMRRFMGIVGARPDRYAFGDEMRAVFEKRLGLNHKRQFKPQLPLGEALEDPLAGLEPTDDLEADSLAEADAILSAFRARERKAYYKNVWQSEWYVVGIWRDSKDLDAFIADFGLAKYGDLYMDGSALLEALEAAS